MTISCSVGVALVLSMMRTTQAFTGAALCQSRLLSPPLTTYPDMLVVDEERTKPQEKVARGTPWSSVLANDDGSMMEDKKAHRKSGSSHSDDDVSGDDEDGSDAVCRVVALADGKLPTSLAGSCGTLFRPLDDIYHAVSHEETRNLTLKDPSVVEASRRVLEDAGFQPLSRRDLDLCAALNSDYLLRLSIVPDVSTLEDGLAREFFPERFDSKGNPLDKEEFLFDGRVLVFRRGYSQEVSKGRLLLPKVDYLQASLVQRGAAWLKFRLNAAEEATAKKARRTYREIAMWTLKTARSGVGRVKNDQVRQKLNSRIPKTVGNGLAPIAGNSTGNLFRLTRYGGSKPTFSNSMDPLAPFSLCSPSAMPSGVPNSRAYQCPYDMGTIGPDLTQPPMQVLERVTIGNVVNLFTREGRNKLFKTFFAKSELVEPTYEEVVVMWRPKKEKSVTPRSFVPKIVFELADMFDVEGLTPPQDDEAAAEPPLEIRTFEGVPMANLPAVLPKTKLVFRPADAFVFDFVSLASFLLVVGSQRFDSPKLDLLALVSVSLWLLRTVLRYSNKLARYDLLVKTFLTSKISFRNDGALRYLATESASQRAARATFVHTWLSRQRGAMPASTLTREGSAKVSRDILLPHMGREVPVNIDDAVDDLRELQLVEDKFDGTVDVVRGPNKARRTLKDTWNVIFEGRSSLRVFGGRRDRVRQEGIFE